MLANAVRYISLFVVPHPNIQVPSSTGNNTNGGARYKIRGKYDMDRRSLYAPSTRRWSTGPGLFYRYGRNAGPFRGRRHSMCCCCPCVCHHDHGAFSSSAGSDAPSLRKTSSSKKKKKGKQRARSVSSQERIEPESPTPSRTKRIYSSNTLESASSDSFSVFHGLRFQKTKKERRRSAPPTLVTPQASASSVAWPTRTLPDPPSPMTEVRNMLALYTSAIEASVSSSIPNEPLLPPPPPPTPTRRRQAYSASYTSKLFELDLSPIMEDSPTYDTYDDEVTGDEAASDVLDRDVEPPLALNRVPSVTSSESSYGELLDMEEDEDQDLSDPYARSRFGYFDEPEWAHQDGRNPQTMGSLPMLSEAELGRWIVQDSQDILEDFKPRESLDSWDRESFQRETQVVPELTLTIPMPDLPSTTWLEGPVVEEAPALRLAPFPGVWVPPVVGVDTGSSEPVSTFSSSEEVINAGSKRRRRWARLSNGLAKWRGNKQPEASAFSTSEQRRNKGKNSARDGGQQDYENGSETQSMSGHERTRDQQGSGIGDMARFKRARRSFGLRLGKFSRKANGHDNVNRESSGKVRRRSSVVSVRRQGRSSRYLAGLRSA